MVEQESESTSRTSKSTVLTKSIRGEYKMSIPMYSVVSIISAGDPIESERFIVGGHEWVLIFFPEWRPTSAIGRALREKSQAVKQEGQEEPRPSVAASLSGHIRPAHNLEFMNHPGGFASIFICLVDEGVNPQGVIDTPEGKLVRGYHTFTVVDQSGRGNDISKTRRVNDDSVAIYLPGQGDDKPNWYGHRRFAKASYLMDLEKGFLKDDTLLIQYEMSLNDNRGGTLKPPPSRGASMQMAESLLRRNFGDLLRSGQGFDIEFRVSGVSFKAHRIILKSHSQYFRSLLGGGMREAAKDVIPIHDIKPPIFGVLLHFLYTDSLPEEKNEGTMEPVVAQHLLEAADRFGALHLLSICEQRLCSMLEVETVATTLVLAQKCHAEGLKRVALEFAAENLAGVLDSEDYEYLLSSCPEMTVELMAAVAPVVENRLAAESDGRPAKPKGQPPKKKAKQAH